MLVKKTPDIKPSEITPKKLYLSRREFISQSALVAGMGFIGPGSSRSVGPQAEKKLEVAKRGEFTVGEKPTPFEEATTFTNFYEFSTGKREVKDLSRGFRTRPWTVTVEGLVDKPKTFDVDEMIRMFPLEERVYRWRCVEAWSMVIPWTGFPLADLLKRFKPTSRAKYVEFTTLLDPKQMPGQRYPVLDWPYVEGLRIDEAMHPLAFMAVGLYGRNLPNQSGAPLRLVVPWKYGFKNIKSIVRIRFTEKQPVNSWQLAAPDEYGFFANVNPAVDHPRWSQATERRIGGGLFTKRSPTEPFNGYAAQVASLYTGMNLRRNF